MRARYGQIRSKLVSVAQWESAAATANCAAAFSGTCAPWGFIRMASMFGKLRNVARNAENSVAAPSPIVPAISSCSTLAEGLELRILETNAQERGDGNAFASRSKALSSSGRKRIKAIISGRIEPRIAHSH